MAFIMFIGTQALHTAHYTSGFQSCSWGPTVLHICIFFSQTHSFHFTSQFYREVIPCSYSGEKNI